VAEDPVDEQLTLREFGCGLLSRFERHGVLDVPHTIFAHGTHLNARDRAIVDAHRDCISVAHNPSSNMNNGVGYAQVAGLQKSPLLGTDGIGADLWREARTALFKSHDAGHAMGLQRVLDMLAASARVAGEVLGVRLGKLEPGAAADLVITNYIPATPLTSDNLAAHVVYALGPEYVRSVLIAGAWCLRDGRVCCCDEAAMRAASVRLAEQLYERMQRC
jgi:cytosine/adenosine deaminase-related metal-dependent hydrolase